MAQVYSFTDQNGETRLFAEIHPDPAGTPFNGGTITEPLIVEVITDNTIGLTIDADSVVITDHSDALLIAHGDPDRLSNSYALRITGKAGAEAARIDAYGTLLLKDSTGSAANGLQFAPFDARPFAYGASSNPAGSGNMLAGFMSGGALLTSAHAAPADGDLSAGECALWFDQTNGAAKLMAKGKTANGTVVAASIALS